MMPPLLEAPLRDAMRRSIRSRSVLTALLAALLPLCAHAQSNVSTQGLGFPPGHASTRAEGTGAAIAEIDPLSPNNPAALASIGTTTLFFQIEPEFRRVTAGDASDRTTTARYPLFMGAIPMGSRWVVALSSATLLDRTFTTSTASTVIIGADTVPSTFSFGSDGSLNDLRLALSFEPSTWFRAGFGAHLVTGNDRVFVGRTFDDPAYASFGDTSVISFSGGAASAGIQLIAPKLGVASFSYRKGSILHATRNDTTLGSARVPDRLGLSVAYLGITGTQIAVRSSYDKWSSLSGLNAGSSTPIDAWDTSVGADITGPRFGNHVFMLRTGARWRTLPYQAAGNKVTEKSVSGGIGTLFAANRVSADVALSRAARDAGLPITERAWILSFGLAVRP